MFKHRISFLFRNTAYLFLEIPRAFLEIPHVFLEIPRSFLEIPRAIIDVLFRIYRWIFFIRLCKKDLKFIIILKVIKTKFIYATHLIFRVYYWTLIFQIPINVSNFVLNGHKRVNREITIISDLNKVILFLEKIRNLGQNPDSLKNFLLRDFNCDQGG